MEMLKIKAGIEEDREVTMARIIGGLHKEIADIGAMKTYSMSKAKWGATWSKFDEQRNDKVLETPKNKDKGTFIHKGLGHIASECPNKRTMVLRGKEIVSESDDDSIHSSMPSLEEFDDVFPDEVPTSLPPL
ncbi:putative mitochondrial protein [Senna tora]|uniref:Putative mitochondrial protein n=1 Tax=Senna tora TaxID=362788 RepID=A0A834SQI7_9FABA|nr:putative mitochondrial protein [Senna tora]